MMARFALLIRNRRASGAAEFGLVLPLLILFLFGILDIGRYMWALNTAEKATQMGVRYAVVSDPVADVIDTDFVNDFLIPGGDAVPEETFEEAICTNTGDCAVTGDANGVSGRNSAAFDAIVAWMQLFEPDIQPANVRIIYRNVGLGYSGDPTGADVAPLTTVELRNLPFRSLVLFGNSLTLPDVNASLTLEDGECSVTGDCGSSN